VNVRDLNAMAIVVSGDSLDRQQHRTFDRLARAEKALRVSKGAPQSRLELAEGQVLDAKAVCQEFGALGSEC
jgi:hypothetical protein